MYYKPGNDNGRYICGEAIAKWLSASGEERQLFANRVKAWKKAGNVHVI